MLSSKTGAGTVCGSCKPILAQLVGDAGPAEKEIGWIPILAFSFLSLILVSFFVGLPERQIADSVQNVSFYESIWNDKYWKQVTGFSLLGLSFIGLLMSLKKRVNWGFLKADKLGKYAYWRVFHVTLGLSCVGLLFFHTGMHLGENLNQLLMFNFIGVIVIGALAGAFVSLSHKFAPSTSIGLKKFFTWSHILITWPLPVLLGIHILTVYYF
jgi:nitrite reductase (NADH) large subunit